MTDERLPLAELSRGGEAPLPRIFRRAGTATGPDWQLPTLQSMLKRKCHSLEPPCNQLFPAASAARRGIRGFQCLNGAQFSWRVLHSRSRRVACQPGPLTRRSGLVSRLA
jgi:hypothetical protein